METSKTTNNYSQEAQKLQDAIFARMTPKEKIRLVGKFFETAKVLQEANKCRKS